MSDDQREPDDPDDVELRVLGAMIEAMRSLSGEQQLRVLSYITHRFDIDTSDL